MLYVSTRFYKNCSFPPPTPTDENNPHGVNNPTDENNPTDDGFIDEPKDFLENYEANLAPLKEILETNNTEKSLTNKEEETILKTIKALEVSVVQQMAQAVSENNLRLIFQIENLKQLENYLLACDQYVTYCKKKNKNANISIENEEYLKKLEPLMLELARNGFDKMRKLFTAIREMSELESYNTIDGQKKEIELLMNQSLDGVMSYKPVPGFSNLLNAVGPINNAYNAIGNELGDNEKNILKNLSMNDILKLAKLQENLYVKLKNFTESRKNINNKEITLDDQIREIRKAKFERHKNFDYEIGEEVLISCGDGSYRKYELADVKTNGGETKDKKIDVILFDPLNQQRAEIKLDSVRNDHYYFINKEHNDVLLPTDLKKGDYVECYLQCKANYRRYCGIIDEVNAGQTVFVYLSNRKRYKITMLEYVKKLANQKPLFNDNDTVYYNHDINMFEKGTFNKLSADGSYNITYKNDNNQDVTEDVSPFFLYKTSPKFKIGQLVRCNYHNSKEWDDGIIVNIISNAGEPRYNIQYDDGDMEDGVGEDMIKYRRKKTND